MTSASKKSQFADAEDVTAPAAQVEITGRNVEVPEHFAERVNGKLAKIERLDPTLTYFHVELLHEPNPRRSDEADRIQITATGKGHIARAEAKEDSFYAALEVAVGRMERSLRKVKARRHIARRGHRAPLSVGEATATLVEAANADLLSDGPQALADAPAGAAPDAGRHAAPERAGDAGADQEPDYDTDPYAEQFRPGQIVRRKEHAAVPMSVDDALSEMELVGHDFYLFQNSENGRPSVVYRRHAYDYGLIALVDPEPSETEA